MKGNGDRGRLQASSTTEGREREVFNGGSAPLPGSHQVGSAGLGDTECRGSELGQHCHVPGHGSVSPASRKRFGLKEASSKTCKEGIKQGQAE